MEKKTEEGTEISVIIPIYNEEKNIDELYERLLKTVGSISDNYEFIFVNDGSTDHSLLEILKLVAVDSRVYYINFSRNFGHQIAVTAGIDACSGKAVVIMDGDLQDPPELISKLFEKFKEGYDVVYAKRRDRNGESGFKRVSAKFFYRTLKQITSIEIPLDTGDFRLIAQKVVHNLRQMPEQNKFLRGQIAWLGFNQIEVGFDRARRKHGKTGYSLAKMLGLAMDGITGFSDKPLQFVTKLGFVFSFLAFAIILYAVYAHYILHETITGWTSLIVSSMFIGGVQLISIGILGEYIGRINKNVRKRPLYIVEGSNLE